MEFFVSTSGRDDNPGTRDRPFRTVGRGASVLLAGDVLNLRHGVHVGPVVIAGRKGTADDPIVIRSFPGEHAYLDGTVREFRSPDNDDWLPAGSIDRAAADDEYVSAATFAGDPVDRGAFLDRNPHTRLVTYSQLNDLRSDNETFDRIVDEPDPRPGPAATDREGNPLGHRHPWVYLGPGIHFDAETRRVHVRLSHTHLGLPGITDYAEETDPRRVRLAIAPRDLTTVRITGSSHVRLERLTIGFGGDDTVLVSQTHHLTLDHVRIRATAGGVRMSGRTSDVVFAHCRFDGCLPPWSFRTDRTSGYHFVDGGTVVRNDLGAATSDRSVLGTPDGTALVVHHCEFLNSQGVALQGAVDFHHNWLNNLQDEGLALGFGGGSDGPVTDVTIHENVLTRTCTAFRFGSRDQTTHWYLYRNLIDLRGRVRAVRPRHTGDADVWRAGQLHVSTGDAVGPHDLFHNTVLTFDQREQASFLHYRDTAGPHRRRSFNNVFVAVNPGPDADRAITFVPSPAFPDPTDGNLYHRVGHAAADPFRHLGYRFRGQDFPDSGTFADLGQLHRSLLFEQSTTQYPPGYEANSLLADPGFRRVDAGGRPREDDDLRPGDTSTALRAGVRLPDVLAGLDPLAPVSGAPDIGCYPGDGEPLRVGVDGCRSFPRASAEPVQRPRRLAGGVWRAVFQHPFLDGDLGNLQAVPGELTVLPDGRVIEPTPDPVDRGLLVGLGRSLGYRFADSFDDVIGVDLGVDLRYLPQPGSTVRVPVVSLGDGTFDLRISHGVPGPALSRVAVAVAGEVVDLGALAVPLGQITRLRVRWHTHGQVHLLHGGVLRAYEPGFAAGRSLRIERLDVGRYPQVLPSGPRFRVHRVYLKLLRRDDARQRIDAQVPLDLSCVPPDPCAEQIRVLHEQLVSRIRVFMTGAISTLTTAWRQGQEGGPFSAEAVAAHAAAVSAAEAFSDFLDARREPAADTFLERAGELFDVLAAADPAGFAELVSDLAQRAEAVDPACRRALEPVHTANAETLQPLARLLRATWQRAQAAR